MLRWLHCGDSLLKKGRGGVLMWSLFANHRRNLLASYDGIILKLTILSF